MKLHGPKHQRYVELLRQFGECKVGSDEMMRVWLLIEKLKNECGGIPPKFDE